MKQYIAYLLCIFCVRIVWSSVLLISLDGFRYDYIDRAIKAGRNVSSFVALRGKGLNPKRLVNVFPTYTFVNHMSLITGRFAENHGIVLNSFYDPVRQANFSFKNKADQLNTWFDDGGEPIWITTQRHGKLAGVLDWPGSLSIYRKRTATANFGVYDNDAPSLRYKLRVALNWLKMQSFDLAMLYHKQPDSTGHEFGPNSEEVLDQLEKINEDLSFLLHELEIETKVNLIITSDHGMREVDPSNGVLLSRYISEYDVLPREGCSKVVCHLWPRGDTTVDEVMSKLEPIDSSKVQVYRKDHIPARLHYKHNRRIAPIVLIAQTGYYIVPLGSKNSKTSAKGLHGYDPDDIQMNPFFHAHGPAFKNLKTSPEFIRTIDIYPLLCRLLRLSEPATHDGDFKRVAKFVKIANSSYESITQTVGFISLAILFVALLMLTVVMVWKKSCKSSRGNFSPGNK